MVLESYKATVEALEICHSVTQDLCSLVFFFLLFW